MHAVLRLPHVVRPSVFCPDDPDVAVVYDSPVHVPAAPRRSGRQVPTATIIRAPNLRANLRLERAGAGAGEVGPLTRVLVPATQQEELALERHELRPVAWRPRHL